MQRSTAKAADSVNSEEQCAQSQNAEVRGAPNSEQCMSGAACPNDYVVVKGYKYPPTTTTPSI
ncbi:hypothetical protein M3J43_26000 [Escherichia coli]|nr:hypothetical protein [Escherichia coli]